MFALLGLRGARTTDITYNDQARHALNGAAIYDMVRDGQLLRPRQYLQKYFARLPALSMPYHPPLFPVFEALVFAVFGVSPFAARLAVACCVFASSILLFYLVLRTYRSQAIAFAGTLTFLSLPASLLLAGDTMLEFPVLSMVLGSLWFMRPL
ncbi:MAG TPA: glycosyltransferase family 39 protein, partial [Bryobacteraceae bacterium]|nr:glycosyltransferase family 39 protein [Bryobacteraceae bacterium]